jgi:hypothetical protein
MTDSHTATGAVRPAEGSLTAAHHIVVRDHDRIDLI